MVAYFCQQSVRSQESNREDITELRAAIASLSMKPGDESPYSLGDIETPVADRSKSDRRSTIFFGQSLSPDDKQTSSQQPRIQILQNDIVYDKELKVSSLEGLQYLAIQMQLLASKYPGRDIKMAHMVAYNLRPHIVANWNSFRFRQSQVDGREYEEVMVEDLQKSISSTDSNRSCETTHKGVVFAGTHSIPWQRNSTKPRHQHLEFLENILRPAHEISQ